MRFKGANWGNETFAWVTETLQGKQTLKVSRFNPSANTMETLFERNSTDAYSSPGNPVTEKNKYNRI